jgi:hypothetical protein
MTFALQPNRKQLACIHNIVLYLHVVIVVHLVVEVHLAALETQPRHCRREPAAGPGHGYELEREAVAGGGRLPAGAPRGVEGGRRVKARTPPHPVEHKCNVCI